MPAKSSDSKTETFTVRIPARAAAKLDELADEGMIGTSRAEIARYLIVSRLEDMYGPRNKTKD